MKPTNELRFVERTVSELNLLRDGYEDFVERTLRVLQQKWKRVRYEGCVDEFIEYEWRDVPTERELK
jgi:hypothetical protein